jgi:hypothetical protein
MFNVLTVINDFSFHGRIYNIFVNNTQYISHQKQPHKCRNQCGKEPFCPIEMIRVVCSSVFITLFFDAVCIKSQQGSRLG